MARLQDIALSGFAGTAPTPVLQYAINNYLINDGLMNLMEFVNIGTGMLGTGNVQASFVYYNGDGAAAAFRAIGVEYTADNEVPLTETVQLKLLGGSFSTDRALARAFGQNPGALSNWTEQQIAQKLNKIKNGFAKYFMLGNKLTDATQFDGLNVFFGKFTSQVNAVPFDMSAGLSGDAAIRLEKHFNSAINKVRPGAPNVVLTTASGKTLLQTLNAYRNRGVDVVEVGGKKYNQYMGINIVDLTADCFSAADLTDKIPFVFLYINEFEGIRTAIPMDGKVVDIMEPQFGNGTFVKEGGVEMYCAPLLANPFAASKCFITETALPVEADKTALLYAIIEAQTLAEADYTTATWTPFAAALAAAVVVKDNTIATQAAVDSATSALTDAQDDLVEA